MFGKKKVLLFGMTISLLFAAGCGKNTVDDEANAEDTFIGIAKPIEDANSLEAAQERAGFTLKAPESLPGYKGRIIQCVETTLIQVIYGEGDSAITFRKGTGNTDISGDYNDYEDVEETAIAGKEVTTRSQDGVTYVVTWFEDGFSYSVQSDKGLDLDLVKQIIEYQN